MRPCYAYIKIHATILSDAPAGRAAFISEMPSKRGGGRSGRKSKTAAAKQPQITFFPGKRTAIIGS